MIPGTIRWATTKMDQKVVTPASKLLVQSTIVPLAISDFLWQRLKQMAPQRARDIARVFSVAFWNAINIMDTDAAKILKSSSMKLGEDIVQASSSPDGQIVVMNSFASVYKVTQALNTPETKAATLQLFETFQSMIDFFSSPSGRKIITSAGECMNQAFEVAASPEAGIFFAEMATNVCHGLEVEFARKQQKNGSTTSGKSQQTTNSIDPLNIEENDMPEDPLKRCSRIERNVLLKMGIDEKTVEKLQKVWDAREEANKTAEDQFYVNSHDKDEIICEGFEAINIPATQDTKVQAVEVRLPSWHSQDIQDTLRKRHASHEKEIRNRSENSDLILREKWSNAKDKRTTQTQTLDQIAETISRIIVLSTIGGIFLFILYAFFRKLSLLL